MKNLKTNFGKLKVTQSQKTNLVQKLFSEINDKYDLMNDLMSFGTHRIWKKTLIELINCQTGDNVIDVGSGTGDISIHLQDSNVSITSVDLNFEMIRRGKNNPKIKNNNINWINCNAEELPFKKNTFDKYIISFCLRNTASIDRVLTEALRTLKPGGSFYCMDFATPQSALINNLYNFYKSKIIPLMGQHVVNNKKAYQYLDESISIFPHQDILLSTIKEIGFANTSLINLFNGIVSIHKGYKI